MNPHLTPAQISEWFAGERRHEVADHVRNCIACNEEIQRFESSLSQFRKSVRGWSGAQFALMPQVSSRRAGQRPWPFSEPGWLTAALALLLFSAVTLHFGWRPSVPSHPSANSDDLLLEQVDDQISRTVPTPMAPLTELVSWDGKQQQNSTESR